MYMAWYEGEGDTFVSAALEIPRFAEGPWDAPEAWWTSFRGAVGLVSECRRIDFGFRVENPGGLIRRLLLLTGPEAACDEITAVCRAFEQPAALAAGTILFPADREAHDEVAHRFPRVQRVVDRNPSRVRGWKIVCDFRAAEALGALAEAGGGTRPFFYQANFGRNGVGREDLRQLRKNLSGLGNERDVPEALVAHQRGVIARAEDAAWLVDEYLGADNLAALQPALATLEEQFQIRFGRLGFSYPPLMDDGEQPVDDLLVTGLHASRVCDFDAFQKAAAAVTHEDVVRILSWRPTRPRSKAVPRVFISYRRDDSQYVVKAIDDALTRHFDPARIFVDFRSIPLGADFRRVIEEQGSSVDVLIAVIGRRWLTGESSRRRIDDPSDCVRNELETALRLQIPIIPVFIDGASPPGPIDLPESLRELSFRNGMPLRPDRDFDTDLGRLVRFLDWTPR